jgi:PAS domain S-box-containing protein
MQEKDTRYRILYEQSFDAILFTSPDGKIYSANPAACKMFQRTEEEICKIGRNGLVDLSDPRLPAIIEERKRTDRVCGELTMIRKDGTKIEVELSSSVFRDTDAQLRTSMVIRDITERKLAEKKVKDANEFSRKIFELSPVGTSLSKLEGRIVINVNTAFEIMFGYTKSELIGKSITDLDLWEKAKERKYVFDILKRQGDLQNYEFSFKTKQGKVGRGIIFADVIDHLNEKYYLIKIIDVTERLKIEEELRKRERLLNETQKIIKVGGWEYDVLSDQTYFSDEIFRIYGTDEARMFSVNEGINFYHPDDRTLVMDSFNKAITDNKPYDLEVRFTNSHGEELWVRTTGKPVLKNGKVVKVIGNLMDITERKYAQEELRKSKQTLERLNQHLQEVRERERSEIALNLHDDIGQKLTAINLNISWIKNRIGVQSKAVKDKIEELNRMIKETINAVQDFSSILRPAMIFDIGPVTAFDSFLKNIEKQSGIKCQFYHDQDELKIGNYISLMLYRILQESVTNIIRHSEATTAEVSLHLVDNMVELSIKDNGVGIEKDKINSLSSMGIAGIMERVRSVHGNIIIEGRKGLGTMVKVLVPAKT